MAVGQVTVRLFAAAREAAGRESITVPGGCLADIIDDLSRSDALAPLLPKCTYLVDGARRPLSDKTAIQPGSTVDVLPPFAGG